MTRDDYAAAAIAEKVRRIRSRGAVGETDDIGWTLTSVLPAAGGCDTETMRALLRRMSILDRPTELAGRRDLMARGQIIAAQLPDTPDPPALPPSVEFVAAHGAAQTAEERTGPQIHA